MKWMKTNSNFPLNSNRICIRLNDETSQLDFYHRDHREEGEKGRRELGSGL